MGGLSIFVGVVSSSSDENKFQQARNPPAGLFYIREKRRMKFAAVAFLGCFIVCALIECSGRLVVIG